MPNAKSANYFTLYLQDHAEEIILNTIHKNIKIQRWVVIAGLLLFLMKVFAYFLTKSVAVFTDALESTVNIVSSLIGLYSLKLSGQPKDQNHPYGHGKVEFISAAIEGTMITIAGLVIVYQALLRLNHPSSIEQVDYGILLIGLTAAVNFILGTICQKNGEKSKSLALIASGKHLLSDTYSSLGIMGGLIAIYLTGWVWLDGTIAILFALIIIFEGFKIVRASIAGIMDETDVQLIGEMVVLLQENRISNWIDLHNLRIIKYGATLHMDCHLTVPWYMNIHEGHQEIDALEKLVKDRFGETVELFVHTDGCLDFSCSLCTISDCKVRQRPFVKTISWTLENISSNSKHRID